MEKLSTWLLATLLILGMATPAYAYLDPSSGSILLQGVIAGIAGFLLTIKLYWQRLKDFFRRKPKSAPTEGPSQKPE